ncbi:MULTISPECIES: DUF302 domain-containing protein [Mycolicibacterium]|uniref:DUF302 domain-containing protein n=1 Tax=Mycolicibacterium smegmatis (strain MKD8) TaxID=1214915 RepID=A0A2U9PUB2_MYCSE|nr:MULTISPECIES: DUF302 domain-containing protein [Mycolicibacterium]AWT55328.1 hypothetical protein D806_043660 [Mycolicibacterium smegmatis MKD8]MBU8811190.1 DUF302 domain-containing protein [Mycolicibacterium goodii]MBU8814983.1 DUF302 domain-containing protein [Mycolicibacterium goodii]MBU8832079.1 DUF302 domain-containing protein [Mycolicibacterium goodii]ULN45766.1 DUF302 domain-containing protein [Mycolicibacterium goodii]
MTPHGTFVDHPSRRLLITLPDGYEQTQLNYETLVPAVDLVPFGRAGSWTDVLDEMRSQAPHGFVRYFSSDVASAMALSGSNRPASIYLMGNHTIAERMYRHDPSVMLHAPLRTLIYYGPHGTVFAVDQPSLLFASYDNPAIAAVGRELDALLAALIEALDGEVPTQLR